MYSFIPVHQHSPLATTSTCRPQACAGQLRGRLVGAENGLVFVWHTQICVLVGKTFLDQKFIYKKSIIAKNITQESAVFISVGLGEIVLQTDSPTVQ